MCIIGREREREVGGPEIAAAHRDEKVDGPRPNSFPMLLHLRDHIAGVG